MADEDRSRIVQQIDLTPREEISIMSSSESEISVPVLLNERLIWLAREVPCAAPQRIETWLALMKLKAQYEVKYGFDFMQGRNKQRMSSAEIRGFLCDLSSVRGERMLDLAFIATGLSIILRIREKSLDETKGVVGTYLTELDCLTRDLVDGASEKRAV